MFSSLLFRLTVISLLVFFITPVQQASENKSVVRGWLADEGCAGERAKTGLFTSTTLVRKPAVHNGLAPR